MNATADLPTFFYFVRYGLWKVYSTKSSEKFAKKSILKKKRNKEILFDT